jgi:uncharacterized protein YcnI
VLASRSIRPLAVAAAGTLLVLGGALPAAAHVGIQTNGEIHRGSGGTLAFRVPHGCGESPTDTLEVQIPDGVIGVQAQAMPGWTIETEMVESEPYERFGETLTERVGIVRWSGGSLDPHLFEDFTIAATFIGDAETVAFPAVQRCGAEETAWIELAADGQDPHDLEHPAPTLALGAAIDEEQHDD